MILLYCKFLKPVLMVSYRPIYGHPGETNCVIFSKSVKFLSVMPDLIRHPISLQSEKNWIALKLHFVPGSNPE